MADWSKPTNSSTYQNYTSENDARMDDLAVGLDPAVSNPTNLPTHSIRWSSANAKWQLLNSSGTWVDLAGTFAINISGNATTATRLATARTINGTSFDGTGNITISASTPNALTVSSGTTGATSGSTFNGSAAMTINYASVGAPSTTGTNASGTWAISINGQAATVTARLINGVSFNHSADVVVEPYVENDETSNATRFITFAQSSASGYRRVYVDSGLSYNPNTNTITANVSGNASSANAVPWTGVTGRPTAVSSFTNDSGYITNAGRAYPRRQDGTSIDFYWSGQSGQPTWLWGSNNGTDFYVWNPSNFSVNYAATAGSANAVAWTNVSNRPTNVSSFTNDSGYITSSGSITGNAATATTAAACTGNSATATTATTAGALSTASGSAPSYAARAWVNFNGTGTVAIRASGNVSSITDNAVGDYTVNFATAMPDENYAVAGVSGTDGTGGNTSQSIKMRDDVAAPTASAVRLTNVGNAFVDATRVNVTIFR